MFTMYQQWNKEKKEEKVLDKFNFAEREEAKPAFPPYKMPKIRKYIPEPYPTNNKLHDAIIKNDSKEAISLIKEKKDDKDFLTVQSLSNSPLLLAMKHGNLVVALDLLENPIVDVNTKDVNGLSVLDWACMLRQDQVIEKILNHTTFKPKYHQNAANFYQAPVDMKPFENYLKACINPFSAKSTPDLERTAEHFAENNRYSEFLDIRGQSQYTDLIFFIRDICVNLKWKEPEDFPKPSEKRPDLLSSYMMFQEYFRLAYKDFCIKRNAIPVNQDILQRLPQRHTPEPCDRSDKVADILVKELKDYPHLCQEIERKKSALSFLTNSEIQKIIENIHDTKSMTLLKPK